MPLLSDGKRSKYLFKKWYVATAKPSVVKLVLKGKWQLEKVNKNSVITFDKNGNSILAVSCSYGEPAQGKLFK